MLENGIVSIFTPDPAGENFVKRGSFGAWIHRRRRLRDTESGVRFCDKFDVRITIDKADCIKRGDLIAFDEVATEDFSVAKCRKIAAVTENRFGNFPHWHLEAEYEYR